MHSFVWTSANVTLGKLEDLVASVRETPTLRNYVDQSRDLQLVAVQVFFFVLPFVLSAALVVLCVPLLCCSKCTPARKYARKQRKIDKRVTQYLKQRDRETEPGSDPFTAAAQFYARLDFGEILDEQMALNNLRPRVGKQNLGRCCFFATAASTALVLAGAVCLGISAAWTRRAPALGSMETSKQCVRR